jgi:leucine dehydrogenase
VIDQRLNTWDGERLVMQHDRATGAWILIAIHSTVLGPAAGGTRMKPYPHLDAALEDALRLSEGMTYKFATPGLPFGGAKAVIMVPADLDPAQRPDLLRRYGSAVGELGGLFLTGPDLGTSPRDMDLIAETAGHHVFCRTAEAGGAGDPGPYTALGVFTAIEAICERIPIPLEGAKVVVQGAGDVGGPLIERLLNAGADVAFSDVSDAVVGRYRDEMGVDFVPPEDAVGTQCDIFVPCALGGVLNPDTIPRLRCRAVAGSANNQLAAPSDADRLRQRGILYAPDFVANVGGAMAMPGIEALGWTREQAAKEVREYVGRTLRQVFETAASQQITTDAAARRIAETRLAEAS